MSTGPYREAPKFLLCPRCGELLDRVFDDVLACMRCHGIMITPPTGGLAFGDPAWPTEAAAMWWKSSLECPVCVHAGAPTTMAAQSFEGTQIDRCANHGLWLDRGELNRLAGTRGDELAVLRRKLHGDLDPTVLDEKREQWRRDVETRKKTAEAENARLAAERARQIAQADQRAAEERAAIEHERRFAERLAQDVRDSERLERSRRAAMLEPTPEPSLVEQIDRFVPPAPTWREQEQQRQVQRTERKRRDDERAEVVRVIGQLESQLIDLRLQVRVLESELAVQRARLRVID